MIALLFVAQATVLGSVGGRVTDVGGHPLEGAEVELTELNRSATTDSTGHYHIEALPPGRWEVRAWSVGYEEHRVFLTIQDDVDLRLDFELDRVPSPGAGDGSISGVVLEEGRREPVAYALVRFGHGWRTTIADEDGLFVLGDVPSAPMTVLVSAPGFRTVELPVTDAARSGAPWEILISPEPLPLPEVLVDLGRPRPGARSDQPAALVVDSVLVSMQPTVVERDVLRAVQVLPSMSPGSDYSAAPYVRGGTPSQTPIYLDGAPLHNPYHLGGFVAAFEPSAVGSAVLHPGGLPSSVPGGLSGLMELHVKDGGRDSVRVDGGAGLFSSATTVSGPWQKGAYLLSGRRTYVDLGTDLARGVGLTDASIPYRFSDVMGKVTTDLGGRRGSVTGVGYLNREGWRGDDRNATWGSDAFSARIRGLPAPHIVAEAGLATSSFGADFVEIERSDSVAPNTTSALHASIRTWAVDASITIDRGAHLLGVGGRWERTSVFHDVASRGDLTGLFPPLTISGTYGARALFVRDRWQLAGPLSLDIGVRGESLRSRGWTLLPRGRAEVALGDRSLVAVSGGSYVQDWWSLRDEETAAASIVAYDVTIPVPVDRPLPRARDVVVEAQTVLGGWTLRADLFRKRLVNLPTVLRKGESSSGRLTIPPEAVQLGSRNVDGAELLMTGGLWGWGGAVSYRFQRERALLDGITFTPRTDRPHRLVVSGKRAWGERTVAVSATWMSGRPYTPALAGLPGIDGVTSDGRLIGRESGTPPIPLGEPNSRRLPGYLRVDLDIRGSWDLALFGRRGRLQPYVSVLNIFNGRNPLWATHVRRDGALMLELGPQLPLLPSFGFRWRF